MQFKKILVIILSISSIGHVLPAKRSNALHSEPLGLSKEQLRAFAESLAPSTGRIQAIRFFRQPGIPSTGVAISTFREGTGWHVFVYHEIPSTRYQLTWSSGQLEDTFGTSWPGALEVVLLGNEEIIQFQGCALHNCPDVFSFLIYVPSKKLAFKAYSKLGMATFSEKLDERGNEIYKRWLEKRIAEKSSTEPTN